MTDTWRVTDAALERLGATEAFLRFAASWALSMPGDPMTPERVYGGLVGRAEWPSSDAMTRALCDNHGGGVPLEVIHAFVACCDPAYGG